MLAELMQLPSIQNIRSNDAKTTYEFIKCSPSGESSTTDPNCLHDSLDTYQVHVQF